MLVLGATLGSSSVHAWTYPQEAVRIERRLASDDAAERSAAARDLRKLSPTLARPVVERALGDDDPEVRIVAARTAVYFGYEDVGAQVTPWLVERDARLRLAATEVLRLGVVPEAIEPLGRVLSDSDERVRLGAAGALGEVGEGAAPVAGAAPSADTDLRARAATALLGHLDDPEPRVRVHVSDALAKLGDTRAVLPLVSKLQDSAPEVRIAVARALGVLADPRATSALIVALGDRESAVVAHVAQALGKIGDKAALPSVSSLAFGSPSSAVQRASVLALGQLGKSSDLEKLLPLLSDQSLSKTAARALTASGERAAPVLEKCLLGTSIAVSSACAKLLPRVEGARATQPLLEALRRGLVDPAAALEGLADAGSPDALVVMLEHLSHPDRTVRRAAVDALLVLLDERPDPRAAGPVLEALERPGLTNDDRARLLLALGRSGAPEATKPLVLSTMATAEHVRLAGLAALGSVASPEGQTTLLAALDDPSGEVRRTAALSLRRSGAAGAAAPLISRFRNGEGQDRAALALALLGPLSKSRDEAVTRAAAQLVDIADGPARDSLIEALAAAQAQSVAKRKLELLSTEGSFADRSKVAQALASSSRSVNALRELARGSEPTVRAEAVWGLGRWGTLEADSELLMRALPASQPAVRTNAAAALALLVERADAKAPQRAKVAERLCGTLSDPVPAVRAGALTALLSLGDASAGCTGRAARLLRRDTSDVVRARAALVIAAQGGPAQRFELRRCQAFDVSPLVADACASAPSGAPSGEPSAAGAISSEPARRESELVFVAPRPDAPPAPRRPFVVVERGVVRAGTTDRRGAFIATEGEPLELLEPGLLESD